MDKKEQTTEKLHFIEEKKLARTIELEKEDAIKKTDVQNHPENPALKNVTNPIKGALLKFAQSKHKFDLKDF